MKSEIRFKFGARDLQFTVAVLKLHAKKASAVVVM
jgi:hypothetical protein